MRDKISPLESSLYIATCLLALAGCPSNTSSPPKTTSATAPEQLTPSTTTDQDLVNRVTQFWEIFQEVSRIEVPWQRDRGYDVIKYRREVMPKAGALFKNAIDQFILIEGEYFAGGNDRDFIQQHFPSGTNAHWAGYLENYIKLQKLSPLKQLLQPTIIRTGSAEDLGEGLLSDFSARLPIDNYAFVTMCVIRDSDRITFGQIWFQVGNRWYVYTPNRLYSELDEYVQSAQRVGK